MQDALKFSVKDENKHITINEMGKRRFSVQSYKINQEGKEREQEKMQMSEAALQKKRLG